MPPKNETTKMHRKKKNRKQIKQMKPTSETYIYLMTEPWVILLFLSNFLNFPNFPKWICIGVFFNGVRIPIIITNYLKQQK